ncbi:MAG: hypothetical protein ACIALR_08145 [Blastopirellula sp. JB062]
MKKLVCVATALLTVTAASVAMAQDFTIHSSPSDQTPQPLEQAPALSSSTPEMWFYLMEARRAENPSVLRLQRAQFIANQRISRIEARKWYGVSLARPEANSIPMMRHYSNLRSDVAWDPATQLHYSTATRPIYVTGGQQF